MAKEKSYGICPYIIEDGCVKVLLNTSSWVSDYNFFKGKIEPNESIKECSIREFLEETSVSIDIKDLGEYFFQKNKRKDIGIYLVDYTKYKGMTIEVQEEEIYGYAWLDINDTIVLSKNQREIFTNIRKYLNEAKGIL